MRAREVAESQASGPFTGLFKQQPNLSLFGSVADGHDKEDPDASVERSTLLDAQAYQRPDITSQNSFGLPSMTGGLRPQHMP